MWLTLLIGAILLWAIYVFYTWHSDKFKGTKVPYMTLSTTLKNTMMIMLKKEDIIGNMSKVYKAFPDSRFMGFFQFRTPAIMLRDPELIRQVGVKDFDSFLNHQSFFDPNLEPLFGNSLVALQDQKWRDMRATLSPAFTGSKMRHMFQFIVECSQQMTDHLKKEYEKKGPLDIEMKDMVTKYANDVIATSAFGIKIDTLENPENMFYKMGLRISNFGGFWVLIKFFCFWLIPRIMKLLNITLLERNVAKFFRSLVHDTMAVREKEGIIRPDMIHLLMQARKGALQHEVTNDGVNDGFATAADSNLKTSQKRGWTDDEITGQALLFFLAGFESISTAICFTVYELAINPDVQKILQEEIDDVCQELKDQELVDYERLQKMKYLDMVVSEGLRKWPAAIATDRVCNRPYVLEDYDGNKFELKKDDMVMIPIYDLHHDEKYYINPSTFDPSRFSEENKQNIKPFTYLPFGVGPRNCIGSRFALMEMKALLFNLLKDFDLVPGEKTQIPIRLAKGAMQVKPENGYWVKFKLRNK